MAKREPTEKELILDKIMDEMGPSDFYADMIAMFGLQRNIGLTGCANFSDRDQSTILYNGK